MFLQANTRRFASTLFLSALAAPAFTMTPAPVGQPAGSIEQAIRASLPYLQEDGEAWLEGRISIQGGQGCVSCHQVPFGVWGLEEARRAGIVFDEARLSELALRAAEFVTSPGKARIMSWGPLVLAAGAAPGPEHADFPAFARRTQKGDGTWDARGQFPEQRRPMAETNAVATMWTMLALGTSGAPATTEQALSKAHRSIAAFEGPSSTEHLLLRSWIEETFGEADVAQELLDRLLASQHEDGGWSWLPGEESNALSTGQVLYRLGFVASPRSPNLARAIERGTRYLLETQAANGEWAVASALTSEGAKPSKDYVYTYWGTAWAAIGLARTLVSDAPAGTELTALRRLRERATIFLVDAPFEVVVSYFSTRLGAELDLDPELTGRLVTVELDDQSAEVGLDALCDQVGCVWDLDLTREPARLRFARREPL